MGIDVAQTLTTNRFDQLRPALDERLLTAVMKEPRFKNCNFLVLLEHQF